MTAPINSIQKRPLETTTADKVQAPQKPAIDTGAELGVKDLRETVKEKIKPKKDVEKPKPAVQVIPEEKQAKISLKDKVVCIQYIGPNGTDVEDEVSLETTHWIIAVIMNLFAKIFPDYAQGAAKFSINDQTCYARRVLIQEKLHIQIKRDEFKSDDASANTLKLKVLSFEHFKAED